MRNFFEMTESPIRATPKMNMMMGSSMDALVPSVARATAGEKRVEHRTNTFFMFCLLKIVAFSDQLSAVSIESTLMTLFSAIIRATSYALPQGSGDSEVIQRNNLTQRH